MKKGRDQVALFDLVFSQNWEDPESDHAALKIMPGDTMLTITSGGCNVLGFLLFDPSTIYSIDINPAQSYMLELKMKAIQALSFEEFSGFAGLITCEHRIQYYERLKPMLSYNATAFWNQRLNILSKGFTMSGRYEGFIKMAGKMLKLVQGKTRVEGLLAEKSPDAQRIYFDTAWNTRRLQYIFKLLFNKRMLARRGLVADYFYFDDGSRSFAESFYNRAKKAFRNIPIKGNYFLHLYLTGKYRDTEEVPAYLKKENFDIIKSRIDRIKLITGDAQGCIDNLPSDNIDCFALSNICELMSEYDTHRLFAAVCRTARQGARIVFRNLMVPREVPASLQARIVKNDSLSGHLFQVDRSFVYGKVAAYQVNKKNATSADKY